MQNIAAFADVSLSKEMGGEKINLEHVCNFKNLVVWTAIYGGHPRGFLSAFYTFSLKKYICCLQIYYYIKVAQKNNGHRLKKTPQSSPFVKKDRLKC